MNNVLATEEHRQRAENERKLGKHKVPASHLYLIYKLGAVYDVNPLMTRFV